MTALVFLVFTVALFVATAAAVTGTRGQVCERGVGWTVPAAVEADPALTARANQLVATCGTVAAVLSAVPLVGLAVHGIDRELPLEAAVSCAAWGFLVACVGGYPFERITQLGRHEQRHPAS